MAPVASITALQPQESPRMKAHNIKKGHEPENSNSNGTAAPKSSRLSTPAAKYRHVAAVHSKVQSSCLSHDSEAAPSFLGFRNLMVIVLGMWRSAHIRVL